MSHDQMAENNMFSLIFAETDTTSNLTESSLYKLSLEPELQKNFREAIRKEILGK